MRHWGFKYLAPVHWIKPSGFGAWFVHRSQTCLFGFRGKLDMKDEGRFSPNIIEANPGRHSTKPEASIEYIEDVSHGPRLELFSRKARDGWTCLGDAIDGKDIRDTMTELSAATLN
jgi:N6-adenosine-specific RNA methylase IME4